MILVFYNYLIPFFQLDYIPLQMVWNYYFTIKNKKLTYDDIFDFIKAYISNQIGPTDCSIIGNVYNCIQKEDLFVTTRIR